MFIQKLPEKVANESQHENSIVVSQQRCRKTLAPVEEKYFGFVITVGRKLERYRMQWRRLVTNEMSLYLSVPRITRRQGRRLRLISGDAVLGSED